MSSIERWCKPRSTTTPSLPTMASETMTCRSTPKEALLVTRPTPTQVYHFTRVEHLPTIVASGLVCDNRARAGGLLSIEIGNTDIKARRLGREVPVRPGGVVADYVPFYFAPRSPMLFAIERGNVSGYTAGTDRVIYLATTVERLLEVGLDPVLTDRNAVLGYSEFIQLRDGEPGDGFIDWQLMGERYWADTDEYPDRRERRMAECLVPGVVPWEAILFVGAKSQTVVSEVRGLLSGAFDAPRVAVRRDWYF